MTDNGYARAAAEYDAKGPWDGSQERCNKCGEKCEDHVFEGRKYGAEWKSDSGVCPDEATSILDMIRDNEFEEIDQEQAAGDAALAKWEAERDER